MRSQGVLIIAKKFDGPPYKDNQGRWLTKQIFWEHSQDLMPDKRFCEPVFSMFKDRPGCINARKTFVELGDPTGYAWAQKYLGDYEHWQAITQRPWWEEVFAVWMHEMNMKIKSDAMAAIIEASKGGGPNGLAAAKFLAQEGWNQTKRGRPSAAELKGELKRAALALTVEDEDMERIGLTVIQGGKSGNGG